MKVIRTIESFYPYVSGPANQAYQISSRLEKNSISSPIYTSDFMAGSRPHHEVYKGVDVTRFPTQFRLMKFCYTPAMKRKLGSEKFDIIHSHNYRNYQAEAGLYAAKKRNRPFILNAHGALLGYENFVSGANKLPYMLYDAALRKRTVLGSDFVVVSSELEVDEALRFGVPEDKVRRIPMGIDVDDYSSVRREKEGMTVLFVGRISRNRRLEPVIRAMKDVGQGVRLRIIGAEAASSSTSKPGYLDELKRLAKDMGLGNVEFAGPKYGKELIQEYKNADVFTYASLSENFGQTMLEAAAAGLPLVCTPVGIAEEVIKDSQTGFIIDFDDSAGISAAIEKLRDFKTRMRFGKMIRDKVRLMYSWDKIMMEYEKLYLKALESRK